MKAFTQHSPNCQIPFDSSTDPENLSLDDEVMGPFWQYRQPEPKDDILARWAIISAYERGAIGATEAYNALDVRDLFGDVSAFMDVFAAGVRALARRPRGRALQNGRAV